jgi:hypothetical protein
MRKTAMECNYPDFPVAVQAKNGKEKKRGKKVFQEGPLFPQKDEFHFNFTI